jgi:hypothetical protein
MNAKDLVETKNLHYKLGVINGGLLFTIQVKVLHHLACLELTMETIKNDIDRKPNI